MRPWRRQVVVLGLAEDAWVLLWLALGLDVIDWGRAGGVARIGGTLLLTRNTSVGC